jgi:hypothetical protein
LFDGWVVVGVVAWWLGWLPGGWVGCLVAGVVMGGCCCCVGWVVLVLGAAAVLFTSGKSAQKRFWVDP